MAAGGGMRVGKSVGKSVGLSNPMYGSRKTSDAERANSETAFAAAEAAPVDRLVVRDIEKSLGSRMILLGASMRVGAGESIAIRGRSGSGKTTLLRIVAGLETPDAGTVEIDGRAVSGPGRAEAPSRRGIGMVFQGSALWPHMTVLANLRFAMPGLDKDAVAVRTSILLKRLELQGLGDRYPDTLSGGEAHRVALARALAPRPRLLLMDEPLTHLDAELREEMLQLFERIILERDGELAAPDASVVVVTHDPVVAERLASRVLVLQEGRLSGETDA